MKTINLNVGLKIDRNFYLLSLKSADKIELISKNEIRKA